ncbi:MAG: sigma-70 family RNA polymerase sigma factor [Actinobacteria bacterium]|nr:sigma-70 family RNA polymerase sigma factor [Actinomycetota bacterium]
MTAVGLVDGTPLPLNASGSDEEWAAVYEAHSPAVLAFARNWLNNAAMAEEVAQDVFVRLWTCAGTFDPTRGSLRSYLLTQTRWRCVDRIRAEESRRKRERRVAATSELYVMPHWEEEHAEAEAQEAMHALLGALSDLPPDERRPIDLAYFGGLTHKEVAKALEWPEGTVKSRIRRGLHRMRTQVLERSEAS